MRDSRAFVFVHIPKTAGSTFGTILKNNFDKSETKPVAWSDYLFGKKDYFDVAPTVKLIAGHQPVGMNRYLPGDSVTVTFLRDPLERTLSQWSFNYEDAPEVKLPMIRDVYSTQSTLWNGIPLFWLYDNFQTRWLSNAMFGNQYSSMEHMLLAAIKNLSNMHVGLTERFDESIVYFSKIYNFVSLEYTKKQVSTEKSDLVIDDDVMDLIRQHNTYDYRLYKYAQVKFDKQLLTSL